MKLNKQLEVIKKMGLNEEVYVAGLSIYGSIYEDKPVKLDKLLKLAETNPEMFCTQDEEDLGLSAIATDLILAGGFRLELPAPMSLAKAFAFKDKLPQHKNSLVKFYYNMKRELKDV